MLCGLVGSSSSTKPGRTCGASISSETAPDRARSTASCEWSLARWHYQIRRHAPAPGAGIGNIVNGDATAVLLSSFLEIQWRTPVVIEVAYQFFEVRFGILSVQSRGNCQQQKNAIHDLSNISSLTTYSSTESIGVLRICASRAV